MRWDEQQEALARKMWDAGISGKEIGRAFHISRNAAIARLNRMGARTPHRPGGNAASRPPPAEDINADPSLLNPGNRSSKPHRKRASSEGRPAPEPVALDYPVTLLETKPHHCRWPMWANDARPRMDEQIVCGHRAELGSSYCSYHARKSRGAGTHSERSAA